MKILFFACPTSLLIGLFTFAVTPSITHANPPSNKPAKTENTYADPDAQENTSQNRQVNLVGYENRNDKQEYQAVLFMPIYPAYGMISYKSPHCQADIAGYVDPFALKNKKLIIRYKLCKVSFDITDTGLTSPQETTSCQKYHPKACNFTSMPHLNKIQFKIPE